MELFSKFVLQYFLGCPHDGRLEKKQSKNYYGQALASPTGRKAPVRRRAGGGAFCEIVEFIKSRLKGL